MFIFSRGYYLLLLCEVLPYRPFPEGDGVQEPSVNVGTSADETSSYYLLSCITFLSLLLAGICPTPINAALTNIVGGGIGMNADGMPFVFFFLKQNSTSFYIHCLSQVIKLKMK